MGIGANITTVSFSIANIVVWIIIIRMIFKGVQKAKQVYSKIDNMDKKIDCILESQRKDKEIS